MAALPYPAHLAITWRLADGAEVRVRPIRPQDAEIEARFVRELSPQARYFRFMQALPELTPELLTRFTRLDYDRELALIAVVDEGGREVEIAVARYGAPPAGDLCWCAIVVADAWQRRGLGRRLLAHLLEAARARGFRKVEAEVMAENGPVIALLRGLGFAVGRHPDSAQLCLAVRALEG
jgi:acetyltransferase